MKIKILSTLFCMLLLVPVFSIIAAADNHQPNPPVIEGPRNGKTKGTYTYYFTITDPDDDYLIKLSIDWGDGTNTTECWTCSGQPQENGTRYPVEHSWIKTGDYQIKAKVWDTHNLESDWSEPYGVSIPKSKILTRFPSQILLKFLEQFQFLKFF